MARKEERLKYALSFEGKGMENEELKENIQLAILDGAVWADKTMIEKACKFLVRHPQMEYDGMSSFIKAFRKAMED